MSNFYGTEIEIWTVLGLFGNTEKNWADYEQLLRADFSCFHGQKKIKFFLKYCSIHTKKLHKMKARKPKKKNS